MIALGGLVEDTYSGGGEGALLGDIPYLGQFFRYDSRKRGKTNLIVFLRPVILRDAASIGPVVRPLQLRHRPAARRQTRPPDAQGARRAAARPGSRPPCPTPVPVTPPASCRPPPDSPHERAGPLPYAFARATASWSPPGAERAQLLLREGRQPQALAEGAPQPGPALQIIERLPRHLRGAPGQTYSGADGNAAEVVADVGQEVDLTQLMTELPAVEDLLETRTTRRSSA